MIGSNEHFLGDLAGDLAGVVANVEAFDLVNGRHTVDASLEKSIGFDAASTDDSESGDDDSSFVGHVQGRG